MFFLHIGADLYHELYHELITNVVPPISNYENIYFSPAQLDDQDSELSPERILLTNAHDFSSNYFDFDQHLLQDLGRKDHQFSPAFLMQRRHLIG